MRQGTRVALVAAAGALAVGAAYGVWHVVKAPDGPPEPAIAQGSPFECGFIMDTPVHTSSSVEIGSSGYTTAGEVERVSMGGPVAPQESGDVPFVQVHNLAHPEANSFGITGDAADATASRDRTVTGVGVVQVAGGVVVATQNDHVPSDAPTSSHGVVGGDFVSIYVLDPVYFAPCPGVTSLDDATMYAVGGSVTFDDTATLSALAYAWQPLTPQ